MAEAVRAEVMAAAARTAYWTRSRPKDRFSEDLAVFGTLVASREVLFHALRSYIYTASCNHVPLHLFGVRRGLSH